MMVQSAAGLYLTALQLVNMAQSNKGEDLEEELMAQKNILWQTFVADPWMDRNNECCNPGTRAIIKCLYKIDKNLVGPAIDMLYNVKVDLENTMENINVGEQFSVPKEEDYEDLYDKRSILRNICIHAAVMLEIGTMYLIHMARGRDVPLYELELFSGEN